MAHCCDPNPCSCPCTAAPLAASLSLYLDTQSGAGLFPLSDPPMFAMGWIYTLTLAAAATQRAEGFITLPNGDLLPFVVGPSPGSPSAISFKGEAVASSDFDRTQPFDVTITDVCGNTQILTVPGLQPITICKAPNAALAPIVFDFTLGPPGPTPPVVQLQPGECETVVPGTYQGAVVGFNVLISETIPLDTVNLLPAATDVFPSSAFVSSNVGEVTVNVPDGGVTVTFRNACRTEVIFGQLADTWDRPQLTFFPPCFVDTVCPLLLAPGVRYAAIPFTINAAFANVQLSLCAADGGFALFDSELYLYDSTFNPLPTFECTGFQSGNADCCGLASKIIHPVPLPAGNYFAVVSEFVNDGLDKAFNLALQICPTETTPPAFTCDTCPPPLGQPALRSFGSNFNSTVADFLAPVLNMFGTGTAVATIGATSLNMLTTGGAGPGSGSIFMASNTSNVVDFGTEDVCLCMDLEVVQSVRGSANPVAAFITFTGGIGIYADFTQNPPRWRVFAPGTGPGAGTFFNISTIVPGPTTFKICATRTGPTSGIIQFFQNNIVVHTATLTSGYPNTQVGVSVNQASQTNGIFETNLDNICVQTSCPPVCATPPVVVCIDGALTVQITAGPTPAVVTVADLLGAGWTAVDVNGCSLTLAISKGQGTGGFPVDVFGDPITSLSFDCSEVGTPFVTLWARNCSQESNCFATIVVEDLGPFCPPT